MPQELNVLRCFSCDTFQVHIVKKAKKWECKICNEKQSIKKVYAQGSGRDCRLHVQKLNAMRSQRDQSVRELLTSVDVDEPSVPTPSTGVSKWDPFLDADVDPDSDDGDLGPTWACAKRPPARRGSGGELKVSRVAAEGHGGKWGEFVDESLSCAGSVLTLRNDSRANVPSPRTSSRLVRGFVDLPGCLHPGNGVRDGNVEAKRGVKGIGAGSKRPRGKWDEFLDVDSENSQECRPNLSDDKDSVIENVASGSNYIVQISAQPPSPFSVNLYNDDDLDEILKF